MTPSSPPPLTPNQKRHLKSLGQTLKDHATVHVDALSDGSRTNLVQMLRKRELLKIRMLEGEGSDRKGQAQTLAAAVEATLVQVVGRVALLYRTDLTRPRDQRLLHGVR